MPVKIRMGTPSDEASQSVTLLPPDMPTDDGSIVDPAELGPAPSPSDITDPGAPAPPPSGSKSKITTILLVGGGALLLWKLFGRKRGRMAGCGCS